MNQWRTGLIMVAALSVSGCGTSWVKLDNTSADPNQVREAKRKCNVDDIIIETSRKETGIKTAMIYATTDSARDALEQGLEKLEREAYEKINACMASAGFKPKN